MKCVGVVCGRTDQLGGGSCVHHHVCFKMKSSNTIQSSTWNVYSVPTQSPRPSRGWRSGRSRPEGPSSCPFIATSSWSLPPCDSPKGPPRPPPSEAPPLCPAFSSPALLPTWPVRSVLASSWCPLVECNTHGSRHLVCSVHCCIASSAKSA